MSRRLAFAAESYSKACFSDENLLTKVHKGGNVDSQLDYSIQDSEACGKLSVQDIDAVIYWWKSSKSRPVTE